MIIPRKIVSGSHFTPTCSHILKMTRPILVKAYHLERRFLSSFSWLTLATASGLSVFFVSEDPQSQEGRTLKTVFAFIIRPLFLS
jgi:hypothetical protein